MEFESIVSEEERESKKRNENISKEERE